MTFSIETTFKFVYKTCSAYLMVGLPNIIKYTEKYVNKTYRTTFKLNSFIYFPLKNT